MKIKKVTDPEFSRYGRVIDGYDFSKLIKAMEHTPLPEDVIYEPSIEELEATDVAIDLKMRIYGELPIQIGYCNGHNSKLNALEYHRSSEVNIAATDMILLLGSREDVKDDFTYETSKVEVFFVPEGTAIEVYATTLHYAPCGVDGQGFKCVVVLPKGTNLDVVNTHATAEDKLLAASNKWLIAHEDAHIDGAFNGLRGENITV